MARSKKLWSLIAIVALSMIVLLWFVTTQDYRSVFDSAPRLDRPLDPDALELVAKHRDSINSLAHEFDISALAIAGIIVAEMSLDPTPIDALEEYYVEKFSLSKADSSLTRLADETERDLKQRRADGESEHELMFRLQRSLTWSIGICQITPLKARQIEQALAARYARPPRNMKKILEALLTPKENLRYCAQELHTITQIYRQYAGLDIKNNFEILTTLYNTGRVHEKALVYQTDSTRVPMPNDFGKYIGLQSDTIFSILIPDRH